MSYREKLFEAAKETHALIIQHKDIIEEKARTFIRRFEEWRTAIIKGQQIALTSTKPILVFYRENDIPSTFTLPKKIEDYVFHKLDNFYDEDELLPLIKHNSKYHYKCHVKKRRRVYFGPPLPLNPMDTLRLRLLPFPIIGHQKELYGREPENPEEDMLRKYFLLTVIHTLYGHGQPIFDRGCNDLAVLLVFKAYNEDNDYCVPEKQSLIDTALIDVKTDLPKTPERTKKKEKKPKPKKRGRKKDPKVRTRNKKIAEYKTRNYKLTWKEIGSTFGVSDDTARKACNNPAN